MRQTWALLLALAALLAALLATSPAAAQSVALQGMMGARALLIVDGSAPRMVAPGESFRGVKVVSTAGDQAVIDIEGKRYTLRVGASPANVGGGTAPVASSGRIVLTAGSGGHFVAQGGINGRTALFMVDTGATTIAMSAQDAERIGIDYKTAPMGRTNTANGVVTVWHVTLASVRLGDVEVRNVEALIVPMTMPYVLLGNSYLNRFQMKRENDLMVLERRY